MNLENNFPIMMGKTCPIVRAITPTTNQNCQTMLALLKKKILKIN
jgi:hypothetical protein